MAFRYKNLYRGEATTAKDYWLPRIGHAGFREVVATLWQTAERLLNHLAAKDVDPVLVGGLAVQHYGYIRMVGDIDVLISRSDYNKLVETGQIQSGQLRFQSDIQVDVWVEGKNNMPAPDLIRDPEAPNLPTLAGLIYTKLLAGRIKDQADIVEMLKYNGCNLPVTRQRVVELAEPSQTAGLDRLWEQAEREQARRPIAR